MSWRAYRRARRVVCILECRSVGGACVHIYIKIETRERSGDRAETVFVKVTVQKLQ